jgi:hypothetical protein
MVPKAFDPITHFGVPASHLHHHAGPENFDSLEYKTHIMGAKFGSLEDPRPLTTPHSFRKGMRRS